jgi:hypothetical protein
MESPEGLIFVQHFPDAWMENGTLWTPASLKQASQGNSKMIQAWTHAMADFCVHGIDVVVAVAAWNHQKGSALPSILLKLESVSC